MKQACIMLSLILALNGLLFSGERDSLLSLVNQKNQPDTVKIKRLLDYSFFLFDTNPDSAMRYTDLVIDLSKRVGFPNGIIRGQVLKANLKWHYGNKTEALPIFRQAYALAVNQPDYYLKDLVTNNMGVCFSQLGWLDSAIKYQTLAVEFSGYLPDKDAHYKALSDLGKIHILKGNYVEAAEKLYRAREYYRSNNKLQDLIDTYINLGVLFLEINDSTHSLQNFRLAQALNKKTGNLENEEQIFSNMGLLYLDVIKDYDSAKILLEKALSLAGQIPGGENSALIAMVNLSSIAIQKKNYSEALDYLNRIMVSPLINDHLYERANALANLGKYYLDQKDYNLSEKYTKEVLLIAQGNKFLKLHEYSHRLLSRIAEEKNNYELAHYHLTEAGKLKDSLLNSDVEKKIIETTFDISLRQKANENELLLKDNEIQQKEIRTQRVILAGIAFALLLVIAFLFIISKNHKRLKRVNEMLDENNRLLAESNITKDKFFSIISHDLRNPFNAFLNLTQIMSDEFTNMSRDELFEFNKVISSSAKKLYLLLENLLDWSLMQRGTMPFNPIQLNLKKNTFQTLDLAKDLAGMKGVALEVSIPEDLEIFADEKMLNTILRNLTSNAVKFTPETGKIMVSARKDTKSVAILVADTGVGMSPEIKNRLFILDAHTGRPGTSGEPSSGLGLILCQEFMVKHGSTIKVESEAGAGTSFYINFPVNPES